MSTILDPSCIVVVNSLLPCIMGDDSDFPFLIGTTRAIARCGQYNSRADIVMCMCVQLNRCSVCFCFAEGTVW